ncbi:MAG: hypothetical protein ABIQ89_02695 [Candidatus Saccharimonadales bacterium]
MFNRKENEIDSLARANEFLQSDNQRLQAERDQLGPYDDVARDLYDTVQQQAALTDDPEVAYTTAYESVRQKLFEQRHEAQRLRIIAENQPLWEKEIDDEIMASQGEAMKEAARQDFFDNHAEDYRRTAEPRISSEIGRLTHAQLIAGLDEATRERLREQADQKALMDEEYKQRLEAIRDQSARHGQLDLTALKPGELLGIDFCARGTAIDPMPQKRQNSQQTPFVERTLKLSILDPQTGLVLVLDDSWQKHKDDLRAKYAIEDNAQLTIGTLRLDDAGFSVDTDVHRGGLLHMANSDGQNLANPFEVSRVWLQDDCIL